MSKHNKPSRKQPMGTRQGTQLSRESGDKHIDNGARRAMNQRGRTPAKSELSKGIDSARGVLMETKQQIGEVAKDATEMAIDAGKSAIGAFRANPMPLALTGLGVACAGVGITWLMLSGDSSSSRASGSQGATMQGVKDATHAATDKVTQLARDAGSQAMQLEQRLASVVKEHPLAAGATLMAIGAAVGFAMPRPKLPNGWLARGGQQVVDTAQRVIGKVEDLAKDVLSSTQTIAQA